MSTYADLWNLQRQSQEGGQSASGSGQPQGPLTIFIDDKNDEYGKVESMDLVHERFELARKSRPHEGLFTRSPQISSTTDEQYLRPEFEPGCRVVVDTNVLMSNLSVIGEAIKILSQTADKFDSRIKFVIPFVVLQELDRLKEPLLHQHLNRRHSNLDQSSAARAAVNWILRTLRGDSGYISLQPKEDASHGLDQIHANADPEYGSGSRPTNDDSILGGCRFLKDEGYCVCLLSNDRSLGLKSMAHSTGALQVSNETDGLSLLEQIRQHFPSQLLKDSRHLGNLPTSNEMVVERLSLPSSPDLLSEVGHLIADILKGPLQTHLLNNLADGKQDVLSYLAPEFDMAREDDCVKASAICGLMRRLWFSADLANLWQWDLVPKSEYPHENKGSPSIHGASRLDRFHLDSIRDTTLPFLQDMLRRNVASPQAFPIDNRIKKSICAAAERIMLGSTLLNARERDQTRSVLSRLQDDL